MNAKSASIALGAFAAGFLVHVALSGVGIPAWSIAQHWKRVENYRAHMRNPANQQYDPQSGFYVTSPSDDHLPSLAALVSAGELIHLDLVLPLVPNNRETNLHWMQFMNDHDDIIEAFANPEYTEYKSAGEEPLHLNLWFRERSKDAVKQLISELEALVPKER